VEFSGSNAMTTQEIIQQAMRLQKARQYSQAEALYRQILALQPDNPDALHLLGVLNYELGRYEVAIDLIRRALALRTDFFEAMANFGAALHAGGHLHEAIATYQRALQIDPNFAGIHNNLGNVLQATDRLDDAIDSYRRAIQIDPNVPEAHNNLGNVLNAKGLGDLAIASFRRALHLRPNYPQALTNLAMALLDKNEIDQSLICAQNAITLQPDNAEAHKSLAAIFRRQGKFDECIAAFSRAIAIKPNDAEAHNNLGAALLDKQNLGGALAAFRRAIAIRPNFPAAYGNLGLALADNGQLDDAISAFRQAIALRPNFPEAQANLNTLLATKEKVERGIASYRQAIAVVPDLSDARFTLGNALIDTRGSNLVMGTAWNLGIPEVRIFIESLRRHYQGDVMMLVTGQGSEDLVGYLRAHGVIPIYFDCPIWMVMHVQIGRYIRFAETLRGIGKEYARVLLTDVSDVLFQADPFSHLPEGELLCFLEASDRTIGDSPSNSLWVEQIYGADGLSRIRNQQISCSGTTIGSHRAIINYIDLLMEHATPALCARLKKFEFGHDQGIHNFLLRTGALPMARIIANGEHVYTVGLVSDDKIVSGPNGTILTPEGRLCPIVHQYANRPRVLEHARVAYPLS
jgi:tetratricopeptide (TPR) repeat protein